MTGEPVPIRGRRIIEVLEEALAEARAGELHCVVVVAERSDGQCSWSRGADDRTSIWRMLGGLESAKHALLSMEDT